MVSEPKRSMVPEPQGNAEWGTLIQSYTSHTVDIEKLDSKAFICICICICISIYIYLYIYIHIYI